MPHRDMMILEFWDRSKKLAIGNSRYKNFLRKLLDTLLEQDVANGDAATESLIKNYGNAKIFAKIFANEEGIVAGVEEFKFFNTDLKINAFKNDGDTIKKGEILIEIEGDAKRIFERERISLNLLQRMSGIATLTNKLTKKLKGNIKLAATRKTLWGNIDKKAVSIGGGLTHRLGLSDAIIIKDNHLRALNYNIEEALRLAARKLKYVEIEVENKKEALTAANAIKKMLHQKKFKKENFFAIMFDKFHPREIKHLVTELKDMGLYEQILLEASGNIKPNNLVDYSDCGVDLVSMGYLTHSAQSLDISQEVIN